LNKLFPIVFALLFFSCDSNPVTTLCDESNEVELWGQCYNIEQTTSLDIEGLPIHKWDGALTGEIPPDMGKLINLTILNLSHNQLTGEIPPEIGSLTNLSSLDAQNNQLTGEIPPEIGNLTNLVLLGLYGNHLTGEIPPEIGNLTDLYFLYLNYNQLTGEVPPEICNIGDSTPEVGNNKLCPPYPSCISQDDIDSQDTSNCAE
tara:strand:- start:400 stop:1008 length:609 start_codon:yes stop_codon:yes gene_type:complete